MGSVPGIDNPVALGSGAILATLAIQWLKNSGWASWFNRETDKANLALSIAVATATSLGIHFTPGLHPGDFVITGNWHLIGGMVTQWVAQHAAYKWFVVPTETLGEARGILMEILAALKQPQPPQPSTTIAAINTTSTGGQK